MQSPKLKHRQTSSKRFHPLSNPIHVTPCWNVEKRMHVNKPILFDGCITEIPLDEVRWFSRGK